MNNIFQKIGGAPTLKKLVDVFYHNMDSLPQAQSIRAMHPKSLRIAKEKLFMFLSGYFGGENLYVEKYGHPRLRQRHLPFEIGTDEANQWLLCMEKALVAVIDDEQTRKEMMTYFTTAAMHIRNKSETKDIGLKINIANSKQND